MPRLEKFGWWFIGAIMGVAVTGAVAVYVERPIPKDISFEVSSKECDARFKLVAASVEEMEVELNGDRGPDKWFDEMLKVCDTDDWRMRMMDPPAWSDGLG